MNEKIRHFSMGGTVESYWSAKDDTARPLDHTIIPKIFEFDRYPNDLVSEVIALKDSREIEIPDQDLLLSRVNEVPESNILVSSGTYLMPEFARLIDIFHRGRQLEQIKVLYEKIKGKSTENTEAIVSKIGKIINLNTNKKIMFHGSLKPVEGFLRSDGGFNVGIATAMFDQVKEGSIDLCMNGGVFPSESVRKDITEAEFGSYDSRDKIPFSEFDMINIGGTMDVFDFRSIFSFIYLL